MAITIDRNTQVITVPQADLTFISGTLYELDTDAFRLTLKSLEADEEGMVFEDMHSHNTEVTVAGVTYARVVQVLSPYQVEFEDGQYSVRLVGSNNNLFADGVLVRNQVGIIATNSAGLIVTDVPGEPTVAHIEATYDDATDDLRMQVWLERLGATVTSPVSCQVDWYHPAGTILFTQSDSSPDAQGSFYLTRTATLTPNTAYYADVRVTDATGSITTRRGTPTVGS